MKKLYFLAVFAVFSGNFLYSQSSAEIKAKLLKNLVNEKMAGGFTFEETTLLASKTEKSVQIFISAEASGNFISRDQFVANVTSLSQIIISGIYTTEELAKYDIKELSKPIGTIDIEIKFLMTPDGIQINVRNGNIKNKETLAWDELL